MDKISNLKEIILKTLDSNKALDIISIDLKGKTSIADHMIIASGTSSRHIQALSEQVFDQFKEQRIISKAISHRLSLRRLTRSGKVQKRKLDSKDFEINPKTSHKI